MEKDKLKVILAVVCNSNTSESVFFEGMLKLSHYEDLLFVLNEGLFGQARLTLYKMFILIKVLLFQIQRCLRSVKDFMKMVRLAQQLVQDFLWNGNLSSQKSKRNVVWVKNTLYMREILDEQFSFPPKVGGDILAFHSSYFR